MNIEYKYNLQDKISYYERMNLFIFLLLTFIPFVYIKNPLNSIYFPKVIVFTMVISLFFIMWLLKIEKPNRIRIIEYKLLCLYLGLICVATIFSQDLLNSIFGHNTRYEGLLALSAYIFFFYHTLYNFSFKKNYFMILFFSYTLISLFGISNYYGILPAVRNAGLVFQKGRAISFFGNPNFFGSYLTLILPISFYAYIKSGKLTYLISSGIVYMALITTFTRSGWLGSLVGFIFILFYALKYNYSKKNLLIIMALFLSITIVMDIQTEGRVISRFSSIQRDVGKVITQAEDYENAGANRMFIWVRVVELIKEKPLLGHGLETMGDVFSEKYMDEVVEMLGRRIIFDKAHNEYLHIAYSTGIPSLIVYLMFVTSILIRALRAVKYNHMAIPVLASVVGYLVQAFFNISVVSVAYIYWIFLGILLRISLFPDDVGLKIIQNK